MMTFIKDRSIEEPEDDPFPLSDMTPELKPLPSTLKYAFLDHEHVMRLNRMFVDYTQFSVKTKS